VRSAPFWFLEACRPPVRGLARLLLRARFVGVHHVPVTGGVVIAPNHVSFMDPVLVTIPVRRPLHYMTLEPYFRVRGLGPLIRWCRAFPVREDGDARAARTAMRLLSSGEALVIFPEGGRSPDGALEAFRAGAFRLALAARVPVVPVTIAGAHAAWPAGRRLPRPGRVTVTYHAPVTVADLPPGGDRKRQPDLLADLVRDRIAGALGATGRGGSGGRGCPPSSGLRPGPS
jgi:1-acyl-sn-glycerol-3-phosphate acyltransferase